MSTIFGGLAVSKWLISESFNLQGEMISKSPREIYLFGEIEDSDENIMDGFSFQLRIEASNKQKNEISLSDKHLYVGVNLSLSELDKLEKQLVIECAKIIFDIGLSFKENFTFKLPKNKKCQLFSFTKSIMSKNTPNKSFQPTAEFKRWKS